MVSTGVAQPGEHTDDPAEGLSRRALFRIGGGLAAMTATAAIGVPAASASAAPAGEGSTRQPRHQERGDVPYGDRSFRYGPESEYDNGLVLRIDGVACDVVVRADDLQYYTRFFPHQGFPTIEDVATTLIDTEGALWVLSGDKAP